MHTLFLPLNLYDLEATSNSNLLRSCTTSRHPKVSASARLTSALALHEVLLLLLLCTALSKSYLIACGVSLCMHKTSQAAAGA